MARAIRSPRVSARRSTTSIAHAVVQARWTRAGCATVLQVAARGVESMIGPRWAISGTAPAVAAVLALVCGARPAGALDLAETLRQVARANPTLAARTASAEAARRRIGPAGAWPAPMLEVGVTDVPTTGSLDTDMMTK